MILGGSTYSELPISDDGEVYVAPTYTDRDYIHFELSLSQSSVSERLIVNDVSHDLEMCDSISLTLDMTTDVLYEVER